MIYRYPRYGELFTAAEGSEVRRRWMRGSFRPQDFRDLQVLSQVAWFDEEFQEHDPEVKALIAKGRNFTLEDQALMGRKQREICALVIPEYRKLAESGQIEISTTPFYHPILPLLCDSDIASVSHPNVPLPPRFSYPEDARLQLSMARDYIRKTFGVAPVGLVAFRGIGLRPGITDRLRSWDSNGLRPTTAFWRERCSGPPPRTFPTGRTNGRAAAGRCE
jgi:alpha-amylase/alpha-mannosidase (GH57 family)